MKFLKTICLIIFKFILFIGVMCLLLSFSVKKLVTNSVSSIIVNNQEIVEMFDTMGIESDKVQEFVENNETQEFIASYVNPILEGNVDLENINIGEDLLVFVKENQDIIENLIGEPLPMEEIEIYATSENIEEINAAYKDFAINVQEEVPVEVKNTVSTFSYLVSNEFRLGIVVICLVSLVVIALIQKSVYLWIRTLGNTLIWCGVLVGIIIGLSSFVVTSVLSDMNYNLDFSNGIYSSLISVGSGILCLIVYAIIKKMVKRKEDKNEISEVSN